MITRHKFQYPIRLVLVLYCWHVFCHVVSIHFLQSTLMEMQKFIVRFFKGLLEWALTKRALHWKKMGVGQQWKRLLWRLKRLATTPIIPHDHRKRLQLARQLQEKEQSAHRMSLLSSPVGIRTRLNDFSFSLTALWLINAFHPSQSCSLTSSCLADSWIYWDCLPLREKEEISREYELFGLGFFDLLRLRVLFLTIKSV